MQTRSDTHTHTHTHTYTQPLSQINEHKCMCKKVTHTRVHGHTNTHTHTRICTHTQEQAAGEASGGGVDPSLSPAGMLPELPR